MYTKIFEEDNYTKFELITELGTFVGEARLNPADYKYKSKIVGGTLAEGRARIKYAKAKKKLVRAERATLQNLYNRLMSMKEVEYYSLEMRTIRRAIKELDAKLDTFDQAIARIEKFLVDFVQKNIDMKDKLNARLSTKE